MSFVIDASIAAAWILPDEYSDTTDIVMRRLRRGSGYAPSLFWHEMRSLLFTAERRGRLPTGGATTFMLRLRSLPIADAGACGDAAIFGLATRHSLSTYDATYLALSATQGRALATLDRKLAHAASREGVEILGPLGPYVRPVG
jgi:predicted nucleic acid-binding protein